MCRICVTPDRIEEIELRHNVRWCDDCTSYIRRDLAACPACAARIRSERIREAVVRAKLARRTETATRAVGELIAG